MINIKQRDIIALIQTGFPSNELHHPKMLIQWTGISISLVDKPQCAFTFYSDITYQSLHVNVMSVGNLADNILVSYQIYIN